MSHNQRTKRWTMLLTAGAVLAAAVVAGQVTSPAPAAAVSGLQVVRGISIIDSAATKSATAYCPAGKRVIGGGGGLVWDASSHTRQVVLTRMEPVHPAIGQDYFIVTGHETTVATSIDWWLDAYAVCADPLSGLHIVEHRSAATPSGLKQVESVCDTGEKVLGVGAAIDNSAGQVGLHVMRASIIGTFSYAIASEDADGYGGYWSLAAFVVCADPVDGYQIVQERSVEEDSENEKVAVATCPAGKKVHGGGGSIAFHPTSHVSLTRVLLFPNSDPTEVHAVTAETTATSAAWDFIVAQAICADAS